MTPPSAPRETATDAMATDVVAKLHELRPVLVWRCSRLLTISAGTNWVSFAIGGADPVRIRGGSELAAFSTRLQNLLAVTAETGSTSAPPIGFRLTAGLVAVYRRGNLAANDSLTFKSDAAEVTLVGFDVFYVCRDLFDWFSLLQDGPIRPLGNAYTGTVLTPFSVFIHHTDNQKPKGGLRIDTQDTTRLAALLIDAMAGREPGPSPVRHKGTTPVEVTREGVLIRIAVGAVNNLYNLSAAAHIAAALLHQSPAVANIG